MYSYITGDIKDIESDGIIIENNEIGYKIYTANPYSYKKEKVKVYIYEYIREDEHKLYGFNSIEEKELFLKLISVKGVGAKMAIPILATGSVDGIIDAIDRENILYLKKFPKIGEKVARQIILDLKGKLVSNNTKIKEENNELTNALEALGYKKKEINNIIDKINYEASINEQVKEALKLLLK